jgi:hypothetical protein
MKVVPPWLVGTRDFYPALAALVNPPGPIFFSSPYTISIYMPPSPSNLGRQSCRAACFGMYVSDWNCHTERLHVKECTVQLTESSINGLFSDKIYVDVL